MSMTSQKIHHGGGYHLTYRHFTATVRTTLHLLALFLTLSGWGFGSSAWGAGTLVNQPMTGSSALGWVIGGSAYLTASNGTDPVGSGWLRLTDATNLQAGYAYFSSPFPISQGVTIQYDYATWGGTGADGYSVFLFDANANPFSIGACGGSLGYAQKNAASDCPNPGLSLGYLGVGVDEFGNFSNPTEGRIGGPGALPQSIAVRGPYNHPSGAYFYVGGTAANIGTLWFNQSYRPDQYGSQYRKVVINLTPVGSPATDMSVDVYIQYGYNQPLTHVVSGVRIGVAPPSQVMIGYGASTGGSTNVHEVRNLVVDPLSTDIDLAMLKSASSPTVSPGGSLTYTVTARNNGPNNITATNVPIIDTMPSQLTNVSWTCTASGGATCGAASGTGNINTTATLPFNGAATYTVTSTVTSTTPVGTLITNSASLTAPSNDYDSNDNSASVTTSVVGPNVTISGVVYNDNGAGGGIAHNGVKDGTEGAYNSTGTFYAKIFQSNNLTSALAVSPAIVAGTGTFSFTVPSYNTYTIILSTDNSVNFTPSFPNANYIYTSPVNYTLSNIVVNSANVTNANFGVYNGTRIDGRVFNDNGVNGSIADANDGIQNAAEAGLSGVAVKLTNNGNTTTYDSTTTDSEGNFSLFTNTASKTLWIMETNPTGYLSVSANVGTSGGTYNIASDYISFAYTLYSDVSGIRFGDVSDNAFTPATRAQNGTSLNPVYYAHTFTPGSGGSVSFAVSSRTRGTWPAVAFYLDLTCSGSYQAGDTQISGPLTASAGVPICILVQENVLSSAPTGTTDQIVTQATFTFTNSVGPVVKSYTVTDTTTVIGQSDLSSSTKTWTDPNGGDQNPGDTLQYTITLRETAGYAAAGVTVTDNMPSNVSGFSITSFPAGATNSSTSTGGTNNTGYLNISNISVPAGGTTTIIYTITIANGTTPGTLINNTATITNPLGIGGTAVAPTVTVSASQIPSQGNKPLYLYDGASSPAYKLSRTQTPTNPAPNTVTITNGASQTWTESPVLQAAVTLSPTINANVPVTLYLSSSVSGNVTVTLACSSGGTTIASQTKTIATTLTAQSFNLSLNGVGQTCAAGGAWQLTVKNTTGGTVTVYPVSGTNRSLLLLPSQNVINVVGVNTYSTAYPGTTVPAYFSPGNAIYTRATVSDPFGSFDIASATITIKDSNNTTVVNNVPMTQVFDSGAAAKIFEYAYSTLPASGPGGSWTYSVTAQEGLVSENTPSASRVSTFPVVLMPNLTVVKSVQTFWDPANGLTNPKAIPGGVLLYTIQATNSGYGAVDVGTTVITDPVPANTMMCVSTLCSNPPVVFTCSTSPACGLTTPTVVYSNQPGGGGPYTYTPVPDANGYDLNVTGISITPGGTFNGTSGLPNPYFSVTFKVMIR